MNMFPLLLLSVSLFLSSQIAMAQYPSRSPNDNSSSSVGSTPTSSPLSSNSSAVSTDLNVSSGTNEDGSSDEGLTSSRQRKFLTLILGIEHDEKLPTLPAEVSFKGNFKTVTRASYSTDSNILRLSPIREGEGILTIHDKKGRMIAEYRIKVRKSKLDVVMNEMKSLLGDIEGIQFKIVNNKVAVDGQILLPRDMSRIYNVVSQFGDQATMLVSLSPLAQKKIAEFIARDINNPEIEVRAVNDKFILQGYANSEDEKNRAEIIAKTYIPGYIVDKSISDGVVKIPKPANDGVINLIVIKASAPPPPSKIVQVVVHYVELQKEYSKDFRFQFMPSLSDQSGVAFSTGSKESGGFVTQLTGVINNLLPKLNWAKSHGHARVLEAASLMVQDGKSGNLKNEQGVGFITSAMANNSGTTQTPVNVGISADVKPVILGERSDSINMDMKFNIKGFIGEAGGAPLTSNNEVNTSIIVRSGQSAAIGGLITNRSVTNYNKLPKGVNNPIISLYASKDFVRNQSQFVVFVTPIIKRDASAGSEKIKKKFRLRE